MKAISYKRRVVIKDITPKLTKKVKVRYDSEVGIYVVLCEETKSVYIGQSKNIPVRLRSHLSMLRAGSYMDRYPKLQNEFNELGIENFRLQAIFNCNEEKLLYWETYYIKLYKAEGYHIYNIQEETNDRGLVSCPKEFESLLNKLVIQLEKGKLSAEQLEQAIYYNEMSNY